MLCRMKIWRICCLKNWNLLLKDWRIATVCGMGGLSKHFREHKPVSMRKQRMFVGFADGRDPCWLRMDFERYSSPQPPVTKWRKSAVTALFTKPSYRMVSRGWLQTASVSVSVWVWVIGRITNQRHLEVWSFLIRQHFRVHLSIGHRGSRLNNRLREKF